MSLIKRYLKAYYRVCRLEYLPGEVPAVFTVLFLGAASIARFFDIIVMEAMAVFLLLYLSGFIINALTDQEIDKKYGTFKTDIPKSVDFLGERALWGLIILHVSVSVILTIHISLVMGTFIPLIFVGLGIFLGLGYSVKPFHFKVRGVWHAIALGSSAFFLPFIFLIYVVGNGLAFPIILFIAGFTFVHYGMEFGNQAIDYLEDKEHGVKTPPVRWGMENSLMIAMNCMLVGIVIEAVGLYYLLQMKEVFAALGFILFHGTYAALLSIIIVGYYIPMKGLYRMQKTLHGSDSYEEGMPILRKICNYAKWQTSGVLGVAVVSGILFLGAIFTTPVAEVSEGPIEIIETPQTQFGIASEPEVEFFKEEGLCQANVNVSVQNDEIPKESGSVMVVVQSWTAGIQLRTESQILERYLNAYEYWNTTINIFAHDDDDTTIKVYLYMDLNMTGKFISGGQPWIIPSKNEIYLHHASVSYYTDWLLNKHANVTVTVFNEGKLRAIGDVELVVRCYPSYSYTVPVDEETVQNNNTIHPGQKWEPTLTMNVYEIDYDDPNFQIILYCDNEYVDNLWLT